MALLRSEDFFLEIGHNCEIKKIRNFMGLKNVNVP
jgi:hypothetical protein